MYNTGRGRGNSASNSDASSNRGSGTSFGRGGYQGHQNDNEDAPPSFNRGRGDFNNGSRVEKLNPFGQARNDGFDQNRESSRMGTGAFGNNRDSFNDDGRNQRGRFDNQQDYDDGFGQTNGRGGFSSRGGRGRSENQQNFSNGRESSRGGGFPPRGRGFDRNEDQGPTNRDSFNDDGRNQRGRFDNQQNYDGFGQNNGRGGFNQRGGRGRGFDNQQNFSNGRESSRGRGGFNSNDNQQNLSNGQESSRGNRGGFDPYENRGFSNGQDSSRGRGGFNSNDDRSFSNGQDSSRGGFSLRGRGGFNSNGQDSSRGNRGGFDPYENRGFSSRQFDDGYVPRPSFIPKTRAVDEIFKDDEVIQDFNEELYQNDMVVEVQGGPSEQAIFESWEESKLSPEILKNIIRSNFAKPRNFQKFAIPLIEDGYDVKGQAETGSGKSAAFLLPIINALQKSFEESRQENGGETKLRRMQVFALIIEPTRELAKQLFEQAQKFAYDTGVTANFAYGEYNIGVNKRALDEKGCDILVGTPGRLKHLILEGAIKIDSLQFLVLDEADRLLDLNFMDDIKTMTMCPGFPPAEERQTLFFSATFDNHISIIANDLCRKTNSVMIKNTNSGVNSRIEQEIIHVPYEQRREYLLKMLKKEMAENGGILPKKLVFVEKKRDADLLASMLSDEGIKTQTVNGDRPQYLREEATQGFRSGDYSVLVTTNVFARGMNFVDLGQVINMDLPTDRETYVHRIGRTGRLNNGKATSFFDPYHQPDRDIAGVIIEELQKAQQEVPDFVQQAATGFSFPSFSGYSRETQQGDNVEAPCNIDEPEF